MKQTIIAKREQNWLDDEENIYSEDYREHLLEDDEISLEEESWVEGYEKARNEEDIDSIEEEYE